VVAPLSAYARRKKLEFFFSAIPKDGRILEIGCADGWVGAYAKANGWHNFTGLDIVAPDAPLDHDHIVGDINNWQELGLEAHSFDAIIAFEVIEHGDFFDAIISLLRPGGQLCMTTPVPHMDWLCKIMEAAGVNQRRTSPHSHLTYLCDFPTALVPRYAKVRGGISQWGIFGYVPADVPMDVA
jgi:2-polyprenyl-3-methyl-5-hydroxy-6-metoxy-1,4-benzoquinol methylase